MALIVAGFGVSAFGLLPRAVAPRHPAAPVLALVAAEDAPLGPVHWRLIEVLT